MADRQVTKSGKDKDKDITKLCNSTEAWSPRQKSDAISDIEDKLHRYYVIVGGKQTDVHVVTIGDKKHLRTDKDATKKNNLDDLPDC